MSRARRFFQTLGDKIGFEVPEIKITPDPSLPEFLRRQGLAGPKNLRDADPGLWARAGGVRRSRRGIRRERAPVRHPRRPFRSPASRRRLELELL